MKALTLIAAFGLVTLLFGTMAPGVQASGRCDVVTTEQTSGGSEPVDTSSDPEGSMGVTITPSAALGRDGTDGGKGLYVGVGECQHATRMVECIIDETGLPVGPKDKYHQSPGPSACLE